MESPDNTNNGQQNGLKSIALIGNHLPRQCGLATFTTHLLTSIQENAIDLDCWVVAMNNRPEGYSYPPQVRMEIFQDELKDYSLMADLLNINEVDVVCLQHEYGIFGGEKGSYIIELLSDLKTPVVTTLHTLLTHPTEQERHIILQLAALSDRLVVMSKLSREILHDIYNVETEKITLIHHGIPDVPLAQSADFKHKFGLSQKKTLLTFGLMSPGKGIETVIEALPEIVQAVPEVVYMVVGATHPQLKATQGEDYRTSLQRRASKLGIEDHIVFHDHFVSDENLIDFIGAADIVITPYLNEAQIISGPLSYSVGMGKAVISTPFWHAKELLDNGRGRLFPFRDHTRLSHEVIDLLGHPEAMQDIQHKAYDYGRQMVWKHVGKRYLEVFEQARNHRLRQCIPAHKLSPLGLKQQPLPEIKLDHLYRLTDSVGVLQHAKFSVPDRNHGYCVDDNARALIVTTSLQALKPQDRSIDELVYIYLGFLNHAFNAAIGKFRNFLSYDRQWLEDYGSEDSHGRAVWALGTAVGLGQIEGQVSHSRKLFHAALEVVEEFTSPRAIAFTVLGIHASFARDWGNSRTEAICGNLTARLMQWFGQVADDDWPWLENSLTYDNARLPQALLLSAQWLEDDEIRDTAVNALTWLKNVQHDQSNRYFSAIGNHGWFERGGVKACFDQQPIEAAAMTEACIQAYKITKEDDWIAYAYRCFNWYLCDNELHLALYDHASGGCRDGLQIHSVNENQGAESTLCWLMALLALYKYRGLGETSSSVLEDSRSRESVTA